MDAQAESPRRFRGSDRRVMRERFAAPDWEFAVGQPPMSCEERNARG